MIRVRYWRPVAVGMRVTAWLCLGGLSCAPRLGSRVEVGNPRLGPLTVAVAPALNFSGSSDFDRNAVADIMASELSEVEGVEVIPVSRVLAVLTEQGREQIASPAHALEVVERLGADAILVLAVTEYEPYSPPVVGLAAQLYGVRRVDAAGGVDPVRISRAPCPVPASAEAPFGPLAQSQRVFDASHEGTMRDVKEFARLRGEHGSPLGWRLYVESQRHYLRYCCHATLETLFGGERAFRVAEGQSQVRDESG